MNQNLIITQYFYRNKHFTDNSLINLGKSLETLPALKLVSFISDWQLKNLVGYLKFQ